jgi:hypothetical protein
VRELNSNSNLPWVHIGDINEISFSRDMDGSMPWPTASMQAFRDGLDDYSLRLEI